MRVSQFVIEKMSASFLLVHGGVIIIVSSDQQSVKEKLTNDSELTDYLSGIVNMPSFPQLFEQFTKTRAIVSEIQLIIMLINAATIFRAPVSQNA